MSRSSRAIRPLAFSLVVVSVGLLAGACTPGPEAEPSGVRELEQARLALLPEGAEVGSRPPRSVRWQHVTLPDTWPLARRRVATRGLYRVEFDLPARPGELWAVWLPRLETHAAVRVNGTAVGESGSLESDAPLPRNRNRPLLLPVPSPLLQAGRNRIEIELAVEPSGMGLLAPVQVGPERALRTAHEWRLFAQITVIQVEAVLALAIGILMGGVYWQRGKRRGPHQAYRYAAMASVLWAVGLFDAVVRDIPCPVALWVWLQATAQYGAILCLMLAFHRLLQVDRRRFERGLFLANAAASTLLALAPPLYTVPLLIAWAFLPLLTAAYEVWILGRAGRVDDPLLDRRQIVPGVVGVGLAVHDIASALVGRPLLGVWLVPYIGTVGLAMLGWGILLDLVRGLRDSERLNRELEARVSRKHAELARNYARLRELECERAIERERQRLVRDMHDGMGGQLVSTLAMVESGTAAPAEIAHAIRDALDDLRLVIDSLDPEEAELLPGLAMLRHRLETRLARDGLRVDWQVDDLPQLRGFASEQVLSTLRIVQEALTNVVKHADADTVQLRTGAATQGTRDGLFIEVRDDGRGIDPARKPGRGLTHMARRAAELGGALDVTSGAWGTAVRLWLPTSKAAPAKTGAEASAA